MDDVITLSSDDSDVEIVGSYNEVLAKLEPLPPLSAVRIDVDTVTANIPPHCIDLTDPRWAPPQLKNHKRKATADEAVVDLTEGDSNWPDQETENLPPDDCQQENSPVNQTSNEKNCKTIENSSKDSSVFPPQQDCGKRKPKENCFNPRTQHQKQSFVGYPYHTPSVKLTRLPLLETHVTKLKTSRCSVHLTKDNADMPMCFQQQDSRKAPEGRSTQRTPTPPTAPHTEPSFDGSPPVSGLGQVENGEEIASTRLRDKESQHLQTADSPSSNKGSSVAASGEYDTHKEEGGDICSSVSISSPPYISSILDKGQIEALCSNMEEMEVLITESRQSYHSEHSSHHSPTTELNHCKSFDPDPLSHTSPSSPSLMGRVDSPPFFDHTSAEDMPEWQLETEEYRDLGVHSPSSLLWQEGSDKDDEESRSGTNLEAVSREDRHFVCPAAFKKIFSETPQVAIEDNNEGFGTPELLCRQSLSLVYTTIEENLSEGTLQLLSDLLQPGFYPPRDITSHLLRGILLDPLCPNHICGKAFNLLMTAQRHHMQDETTIAWDWELLTSVMENQDHTKRYRYEVVRMLLEYIVQTLEDDFRAKRSTSSLNQSIAKAMLSCDQQFPRVRDVINWMFSAIKKTTECGESKETSGEKDQHIRIVSAFQRMLSLALEVDHSPALNSTKLAQELFHMLISTVPVRAHRMLLLHSLQSELLRCKLLAHLLDFACPVKINVPMSLSLLLHFLKNCVLAPEPTDVTKRWQMWEELVHLLWMLLFSYNKAMRGYLYSSLTEQRNRTGMSVYKPDDRLTKSEVCEAMEAFLCRSKADLSEALPPHVEESLTYLQDHLLDICQS
ncbi:SUMO-interacting motif-containing protein 1 [Parambassis ranga]|uniref:SUMO-interacting motif-containing protein 1 n=1 Tax=Parambassis ranga TaxID=210632 RepID=A0A6P7J9P2_9TELE|nr:SUMO-interacting motif-containing protein 1 [Parambassis ranga]